MDSYYPLRKTQRIDPRYQRYKKRYYEKYHSHQQQQRPSVDYREGGGGAEIDEMNRSGGGDFGDAVKFATTKFTQGEQEDLQKMWTIFSKGSTTDLKVMESTPEMLQQRKERFADSIRRLGDNVSSLLLSSITETLAIIQSGLIQPLQHVKNSNIQFQVAEHDSKHLHLVTQAAEGLDMFVKRLQTLFTFFAQPDVKREELRNTTQKWISETYGPELLKRWLSAKDKRNMLRIYLTKRDKAHHHHVAWLHHIIAPWSIMPVGYVTSNNTGGDAEEETISAGPNPNEQKSGIVSRMKSMFATLVMKNLSGYILNFIVHTALNLVWMGSLSNLKGGGLEAARGFVEPFLVDIPALKYVVDKLIGRLDYPTVLSPEIVLDTASSAASAVGAVGQGVVATGSMLKSGSLWALSLLGNGVAESVSNYSSDALDGLSTAVATAGLDKVANFAAATASATTSAAGDLASSAVRAVVPTLVSPLPKFVEGYLFDIANYINTGFGFALGTLVKASPNLVSSALSFVGGWVWTGITAALGSMNAAWLIGLACFFFALSIGLSAYQGAYYIKVVGKAAANAAFAAAKGTWSLWEFTRDALIKRAPTQAELTTLKDSTTTDVGGQSEVNYSYPPMKRSLRLLI